MSPPRLLCAALAACLGLAPSLAGAQIALQEPVTTGTPDTLLVALGKLYSNDLYLQSLINSRGAGGADSATLATLAPLDSPALTGTPTAPTATAGTSTTQLATTAFVTGAVASGGLSAVLFNSQSLTAPQQATARGNISAAASGANSDITALSGLTTPLSVAQGGTGTTTGVPVMPLGQVRLTYSSASALLVMPYNGNQITVNGAYQTVPAGGVTCSNFTLTAATLYYAYVYVSGGSLACEMATTGHATGPNGQEIKSGDPTRTLVGMAYTDAGTPGTFADSATKRFVASWFNRRGKALEASVSSYSSGSTSAVQILPLQFVTWADEIVRQSATGNMSNNTAGSWSGANLWIDGAVAAPNASTAFQSSTAGYLGGIGLSRNSTLSEGAHTANASVNVSGGTGQWTINQTVGVQQ